MAERAGEQETLEAWDALSTAIKRAECALPDQMTSAMAALVAERERFEELMLCRSPKDPRP